LPRVGAKKDSFWLINSEHRLMVERRLVEEQERLRVAEERRLAEEQERL
jgi:hypothetical protein